MKSEAVHPESLKQTHVAHKAGKRYGVSFHDIIFTGDSTCALSPFLMNPFANLTRSSEEHYNRSHNRTLCVIDYVCHRTTCVIQC